MAALRNGSKCSRTVCMLCFFTASRLALNSNLIFEIDSIHCIDMVCTGNAGLNGNRKDVK